MIATYLERAASDVEAGLGELLPAASEEPRELHEAMRYSALGGGKRMRPALVFLSAEACGVPRDVAMPVACAYECVHVYSLIHDDLPAMDDDDLRRGKPTCHKVFGEAMAILAGDALLTFAFELAARAGPRGADLALDVARAAGAAGMVGGQALVIREEGKSTVPPARDLLTLERVHRKKTAALIRGAARAGAILAGSRDVALGALSHYGEFLGLAFQVWDDVLDVERTTEELGKTAGKDARAGKLTYPALLGLAAAKARANELAAKAKAALSPLDAKANASALALLRELADLAISRTK